MSESDTPRTDEAFLDIYAFCKEDMIPAIEFARQLERELTATRADAEDIRDMYYGLLEDHENLVKQRDRLAEALQLFLNRVQYNSVFMDGKLRGGTFDYRSSGFDDEVTQAYEALQSLTTKNN